MKRKIPKPALARPTGLKPISKMNKAERATFERQHQEHIAEGARGAIQRVLDLQHKMEPALQELRAFAELLGQPLFKTDTNGRP